MLKWNGWGLTAFWRWIVSDFAFFLQFLDVLINTKFGNSTNRSSTYFEGYPFIRFRNEKLLGLQVWIKTPLRFRIGVGNIVP